MENQGNEFIENVKNLYDLLKPLYNRKIRMNIKNNTMIILDEQTGIVLNQWKMDKQGQIEFRKFIMQKLGVSLISLN